MTPFTKKIQALACLDNITILLQFVNKNNYKYNALLWAGRDDPRGCRREGPGPSQPRSGRPATVPEEAPATGESTADAGPNTSAAHASRMAVDGHLPHPLGPHRPIKGLRMGIAVNENPVGSPDFRRPDREATGPARTPFRYRRVPQTGEGQLLDGTLAGSARKIPGSSPGSFRTKTLPPRQYFPEKPSRDCGTAPSFDHRIPSALCSEAQASGRRAAALPLRGTKSDPRPAASMNPPPSLSLQRDSENVPVSFFPASSGGQRPENDPIRTVSEEGRSRVGTEVIEITKSSPWIMNKEGTMEGSP